MRFATIIAASVALAGCAAQNPPQPAKPPAVVDTKAPRCSNKTECERMWVAAQEQISQLTGMRIRMVTDSRIETFAPTSYRQMTGGYVTRVPVEPGVYELRAEIYCFGSGTGCADLRASGINAFNSGMYFSADPPWQKK